MPKSVYHLVIKGRIPAKKNNRVSFRAGGKIPLSVQYQRWAHDAAIQLLDHKGLALDRVDIQIMFWMPDNRRTDMDNKITSIFDLLKDINIIKDDSWQTIRSFYVLCSGIDRKNPRAEIWIRKL